MKSNRNPLRPLCVAALLGAAAYAAEMIKTLAPAGR
jgi:hypothetical protein